MGYITINTDVDVYLDDFSDDDILEEAYDRLREFLSLGKIREKDQRWVDKFSRLLTGSDVNEYPPSSAYYIRSQEELNIWMGKENAQ